MSANFKTYTPKVKILNKKILGDDYNIGEFIRSASGQSSMGQPANTIVLQLTPAQSNSYPGYIGVHSIPFWLKTIKKGDLISVGIEEEHSWLYRVDSVRRTKRLSTTGADIGVRILGRSMASVLLDDDIVFAPELAQNPRSIKLLGALRASFLGFLGGLRGLSIAGISQFLNGNPLAAILWIFLNMPSVNSKVFYVDYDKGGNPLSSYTEKIGGLFDFEFMMYEKDLLYNVELNQYTGKVWNYIEQCLDPMFYELFEETKVVNGKLRPTIIIRPKPFDRTTDRAEVINSKIIRLKVERNGDVEQGDFIITPHPIKLGDQTVTVYDVGVKGFNSDTNTYDNTVERVTLFWDNENTPPLKEWTYHQPEAYRTNPRTGKISPTNSNAFFTCVTYENFHEVDISEDYEWDLGSTTQNIVNFITMHAMKDLGFTEELATLGFMYPLIDSNSVLQWGSRRMEARTLMMHASAKEWTQEYNKDFIQKPIQGAKVYPLDAAVKLRERVFSWYRYNPLFLSGTARVLGHDYYRRGDKIYFEHHLSDEGLSGGMYYYIQGAYWSYEVSQGSANYITTLDLARGENKESLEQYRYNAGYDLYDRNIESEDGRENPVLKIDVILETTPDGSAGGKLVTQQPIISTNIAETDPENTSKNGMAFQQGLTQKAHNTFKDKLGNEALKTLIDTAAKYGINPNVMVGLMDHESAGLNPDAKSSTNCLGLGQFSSGTAKTMNAFADEVDTITPKALSNDVRRNPIKSIKAVGELLNRNGYLKNPVYAIMKYGNNEQTDFFSLIADSVSKFQTGVFTSADKKWATANYGSLSNPKKKSTKK